MFKNLNRKWLWILDAVLFIGFLLSFWLDFTGLELHQWLGVLLAFVISYHLMTHLGWLEAVLQALFSAHLQPGAPQPDRRFADPAQHDRDPRQRRGDYHLVCSSLGTQPGPRLPAHHRLHRRPRPAGPEDRPALALDRPHPPDRRFSRSSACPGKPPPSRLPRFVPAPAGGISWC